MSLFDILFGKRKPPPGAALATGAKPEAEVNPEAKPEAEAPAITVSFSIGQRSAAPAAPVIDTAHWKTNPAHLLLLSKYRYGARFDYGDQPYWEPKLEEPAITALRRFVETGLLVPAPLEAKMDQAFKVTDLKPLLKALGLPVSGKKDALISRLIAADESGMAAKVADLDIVQCSPEGKILADAYLAQAEEDRQHAERKCLALLKERKFEQACHTVYRYEARQIFSRGLGIDWRNHEPTQDMARLIIMFATQPKILAGLAEADWEPLRLAAAMAHLWGSGQARQWLEPGFTGVSHLDAEAATRMVQFHASHVFNLNRYRAMGIKRVTVLGCGSDSCPTCQALGDKTLPIEQAPELPHPGCTHPIGCRCNLVAEFDR